MTRSPALVVCVFLAVGSPALTAQDSAAAVYERFAAAQTAAGAEVRAAAARSLLADQSELFAAADTQLAADSLVLAAKLLHARRKDFAGAARLLDKVVRERLSADCKPTYDSLVLWTASDAAHAAMIGKPAPELRALKVVQGDANLSLAKLRGRVVLLDYWAT